MKHRSNIAHLALLVASQLACALAMLFSSASMAHPVVAGPDKTLRIEKTVEARQVDFSNEIHVPAAPERFPLGDSLLPDWWFFTSRLPQYAAIIVPSPASFIRKSLQSSICINAP